jgi:2'-5' RNA ligase
MMGAAARPLPVVRRAIKAIGRRAGVLEPDRHTELVIPIDCAAPALAGWTPAAGGIVMGHHLTVIDPFVPSFLLDADVLAGVREALEGFGPFSYELAGVGRFPGVLYLAPEPAEPFVAMTQALWQRFPEHPPYEGRFEEIVPHVTLALGAEPPGLAEHVAARLPVHGHVDDVWLFMEDASGAWGPAERFALGRRG